MRIDTGAEVEFSKAEWEDIYAWTERLRNHKRSVGAEDGMRGNPKLTKDAIGTAGQEAFTYLAGGIPRRELFKGGAPHVAKLNGYPIDLRTDARVGREPALAFIEGRWPRHPITVLMSKPHADKHTYRIVGWTTPSDFKRHAVAETWRGPNMVLHRQHLSSPALLWELLHKEEDE